MALIQIIDLSFTYPGAVHPVFKHVNLELDTNWRLGLVGRNGRGKTTFLKLMMGEEAYQGQISSPLGFEYFPLKPQDESASALAVARAAIAPFDAWEAEMAQLAQQGTPGAMEAYGDIEMRYTAADGYTIDEAIAAETGKLGIHPAVLQQPFGLLSGGEQVKLLLAALFLKKHRFLLIDEPTDHLDAEGRQQVAKWLATKHGFILVSHDRSFLDGVVDHVLSINRADIELQRGNYSTWRHNRALKDGYELAQNQKLEADISRLKAAAERTGKWADKVEKSKKGGSETYNRGAASVDRGYIGHKAAKMMHHSKAIERRQTREIEEKQQLLKNIEAADPLKVKSLEAPKRRFVTAGNLGLCLGGRPLFSGLSFSVDAGERVAVAGANGSGKSSLLKLVKGELAPSEGSVHVMPGLVVSSLQQDTDALCGDLAGYAEAQKLDRSLFFTLLRKLNFEREAFERRIETYSAGQKKKVELAASLAKPAHLFIWDEPLNYIDVHSREQIETAVLACGPTLLFVEHDKTFLQRVATKVIELA